MRITEFLDKKLFEFWLWMGEQFFENGIVASLPDGEVLGVVFSNDKDFISSVTMGGKLSKRKEE